MPLLHVTGQLVALPRFRLRVPARTRYEAATGAALALLNVIRRKEIEVVL